MELLIAETDNFKHRMPKQTKLLTLVDPRYLYLIKHKIFLQLIQQRLEFSLIACSFRFYCTPRSLILIRKHL